MTKYHLLCLEDVLSYLQAKTKQVCELGMLRQRGNRRVYVSDSATGKKVKKMYLKYVVQKEENSIPCSRVKRCFGKLQKIKLY